MHTLHTGTFSSSSDIHNILKEKTLVGHMSVVELRLCE